MSRRIPHADTEVRKAFQHLVAHTDVITTGPVGAVLVGAGSGVTPAWSTILTTLTLLTVDDITLNGAVISSGTGAISFSDENLTTTGTIAGVNVTSGSDPGHTHTGASLSGVDISDDTNLAVSAPIVLTDDTLSLDQSAVDHGSIGGLGDDDHTIYLLAAGTRDLTGNMAVDAGITIDGRDISVDGGNLDTLVSEYGKLKVDVGAAADYLGAAAGDGVLRTSTGISYADGGNFVTLTTNDGEINHDSLANTHNLTSDINHATITGAHNLTTDINHASITGAHNLTTDIDHDSLTNYDANKHVDHTGVEIATAATSGISGGGTIASTRNLALNINGLTGESAIVAADTIPFYDATAGANRKVTLTELSTALGAADEKVKVDAAATAGYLGAASGDGVLRTGTGLGYADGGNFVTLTLSHLGIESLSDAGADKMLFWDDGASATAWLAVTGTGKGIITTNLEINSGFVDRGDPANWDFILTDITADATWRDMDLSGIVPAGAYAVDILCIVGSTVAVSQAMYFRKKGYTQLRNTPAIIVQNTSALNEVPCVVPLDSNGKIQYNCSVNITTMLLVVKGWFI